MKIAIFPGSVMVSCPADKEVAVILKSINGWKFNGSQWLFPIASLPALRTAFPDARVDESPGWRAEAARVLCQKLNRVGLSVVLRHGRVMVTTVNGVGIPPPKCDCLFYELEFDIMALLQAGEEFTVSRYGNPDLDPDPVETDDSLEAKLLRGWRNAAENERKQKAIIKRRYWQSRKEKV